MWDTLGHSCGQDTLVGHSCETLSWDTLPGHSCGALLCRSLWASLVGHCCGGPLKSPKVNCHVSRARVSYQTSSKSHTSSLQNEHFIRDFLKNSRLESAKRAFRTRRPPKLTCQSLQNRSISHKTSSKSQAGSSIAAHTSSTPAKQFCDSSPSKQHPLTRQSQCQSDTHLNHNSQPHDSLRLPRNLRVHMSLTHKVLRLPQKMTISYHVSFNK